MKWLRKLFGYKYKVMFLETDWGASEFQGTAICKVHIDSDFSERDFRMDAKLPIFSYLKDHSPYVMYVKEDNGLNKMFFFRSYQIQKHNNSVLQTFNSATKEQLLQSL